MKEDNLSAIERQWQPVQNFEPILLVASPRLSSATSMNYSEFFAKKIHG